MSRKVIKNLTLTLSVGLFIISLTQNPYCTSQGCGETWSGLAILISGIFGFFLCLANTTWLANPLIFFAWFYAKKDPKTSLILSGIAGLLAISFLFFDNIITDEAGNISKIVAYKSGYWLWVSSMITMLLGNMVLYFRQFTPSPTGHN